MRAGSVVALQTRTPGERLVRRMLEYLAGYNQLDRGTATEHSTMTESQEHKLAGYSRGSRRKQHIQGPSSDTFHIFARPKQMCAISQYTKEVFSLVPAVRTAS